MKRAVLALLFCAIPALAADTYTIKLKKRDKGDTLAIETEEKGTTRITVTAPDGKELEKVNEESTTIVKYREAVMEKEADKRPSKLKRTYDQATAGTAQLPYHGKTVVIEKAGMAFKFVIDGKELKPEQVGGLAKEFSDPNKAPDEAEKFLLPAKPVAVGDSWKPNLKDVFNGAFGEESAKMFDLTTATANAKFTKVYTKDKLTFGVLEVELGAPLKLLPGNNFPCDPGAKFSLKMTLDVCIDGTQETGTLKAEMQLSGTAKVVNNGKDTGNKLKFDISATTTDSKLQYKPQ